MKKFELIENWKTFYKMYSVWFFLIIANFPEIYQILVEQNVLEHLPASFNMCLKLLSVLGIISRLIKQNKK